MEQVINMIPQYKRTYDEDDIGNTDHRKALRSQQEWLERNGTPFEEQVVLDDVEDWTDAEARAEDYRA